MNGPDTPELTVARRNWMDLQLGMFISFGINTYYDKEWSDGTLDPVRYNPEHLDTDQWCRIAAAAGMNYVLFICKHHDGFCNWQTAHTDYAVQSTPFKKDVLAALANSTRKYGLKLGLYYSLWDRHEKSHDRHPYQYIDFVMRQMEELLTGYGEIVEMWFDGMWKKQAHGWDRNAEGFIKAWRMEGAYRWQMDRIYQYIKRVQPHCIVMNNATTQYPGVPLHPVDARSGEKATGFNDKQKIWEWKGEKIYLPLQIETTLSQKGPKGQFESGSWFWHEWDDSVASVEQIQAWIRHARSLDANLLLNCAITPKGKLRTVDEMRLLQLNALH